MLYDLASYVLFSTMPFAGYFYTRFTLVDKICLFGFLLALVRFTERTSKGGGGEVGLFIVY